jgi:multimeric flavodoxin WrbA
VHRLAHALAQGAGDEGADVRVRHVEEIFSEELISQNQYWGRHRSEVEDEPVASLADLEWADGIAFGTPTRFGNVAAQLTVFLDLAGELWMLATSLAGSSVSISAGTETVTREPLALRPLMRWEDEGGAVFAESEWNRRAERPYSKRSSRRRDGSHCCASVHKDACLSGRPPSRAGGAG